MCTLEPVFMLCPLDVLPPAHGASATDTGLVKSSHRGVGAAADMQSLRRRDKGHEVGSGIAGGQQRMRESIGLGGVLACVNWVGRSGSLFTKMNC